MSDSYGKYLVNEDLLGANNKCEEYGKLKKEGSELATVFYAELYRLVDVLKKSEDKLRVKAEAELNNKQQNDLQDNVVKTVEKPTKKSKAAARAEKKNKKKRQLELVKKQAEPESPKQEEQPKLEEQPKTVYSGNINTVDWADASNLNYSNDPIPENHRDFQIVRRNRREIDNVSFLHTYLGYKKACEPGMNCWDMLLDYNTEEKIGAIPHIKLSGVWDLYQRYCNLPISASNSLQCDITYSEWNAAVKILENYILNSDIEVYGVNKKDGILLQHLFKVPTIDYQFLFIRKGNELFKIVKAAILCDIEETAMAVKQWKKIKNYKYMVSLSLDKGGIFSAEDAKRITETLGIKFLNEISVYNVYDLKSLGLAHSFGNIVKDINAAFREDKQRRRDLRLQKLPYIAGNVALVLLMIFGYRFKYTLIKNDFMTIMINLVSSAFILVNLVVAWACIRVKKRRKKHPDYSYMTKKIKKRLRFMSAFAVFVICSLIVFYQRYDGYNNDIYYRDIAEGEIAIAGLVDKDLSEVMIPVSIDGKTVTEIDGKSFDGEYLKSVKLPSSLKLIDDSAFKNCSKLESVTYANITGITCVINKDAFMGCRLMTECTVTKNATYISESAFDGCASLLKLDLSLASSVEQSAFNDCPGLETVIIGQNLEVLPDSIFKNCYNLKTVIGFENAKHIGNEAFSGCRNLTNVNLQNVEKIGKESFKNCSAITKVYISETTEEIGENAFSGCSSIVNITIPFVGKNLSESSKSSLRYFFDPGISSRITTVTVTAMPEITTKTFENCSWVSQIVLGSAVSSIEAGAFKKSGITKITLSPSITYIGAETFYDCDSLSQVLGTESVVNVAKEAFYNCTSLSGISLPVIKSIGEGAFFNCYAMSGSMISGTIESIGNKAFASCESLKEIDFFEAPLTSVGSNAFNNCSSLQSVKMPATFTSVPEGCFAKCNRLDEILLGATVTEIYANAFKETGLKEIDLSNVTYIGDNAFNGCYNLTAVTVPDTVKTLGASAFANCDAMTTFTGPFTVGNVTHTYNTLLSGSAVTTLNVTKISKVASGFIANSYITEVTFTCEFEEVANEAFASRSSLKTVTLPDTVKIIGKNAFMNCSKLSDFVIPASVTTIGEGAFSGCTRFKSIDLPSGITAIERSLFKDCKNLTTVNIPSEVTVINDYAFSGCSSIQTITFTDKLTFIGSNAFNGCSSIEFIDIPGSVSTISSYAFSGCSSATSLKLENGVINIDDGAFKNCYSITAVVIPDSVTTIGESAFMNCSRLKSATVSSKATSIGWSVFNGCSSLASLTVPFIGETINDPMPLYYLTDAQQIEEIRITAATKLANYAFENQSRLTMVVLNSELVNIGSDVFSGCYRLRKIIVPVESVWEANKYYLEGLPVYSSMSDDESYEEKADRIAAAEDDEKKAEVDKV